MAGGRLEKRNIEHVKWIDSTSIDAWSEVQEVAEDLNPHVVDSVGFFVKENQTCIWLALNYDSNADMVSCSIMIPKVAIQERRVLCQIKMMKLE
jgi:hypothetical protein